MARCLDLVFCGVAVFAALALHGCGGPVPACEEKCGQYSTALGAVDATTKNVCMVTSKETGGLTMCTASVPLLGCKSPDAKVNATLCSQTMDPAAKSSKNGITQAKDTPKCVAVCKEFKDSLTLESPAVCFSAGVCTKIKDCEKRRLQAAAPVEQVNEEATAAANTAKDSQEVVKDAPGGGTLCKPIAPPGAKEATKAVEAAEKPLAKAVEGKKLFLSGVLPDGVVTTFANLSMGLVVVGLLVGAVVLVSRRQHASAESEELEESDEEASGRD